MLVSLCSVRAPGSSWRFLSVVPSAAAALGICLCLLLSGFSETARAADADPETLIRQGVELRRRGDNERAHGYFKRAYEVSQTPRSAAQLGLVEQALSMYLKAEAHLHEALAISDDAWVKQNRRTLEGALVTVRSQLGRAEISRAPPGTTVAVDDQAAVPVREDGLVWLEAGGHVLTLRAAGRGERRRSVAAAAGETVRIEADLSRIATAPSEEAGVLDTSILPEPKAASSASERAGAPPAGGAAEPVGHAGQGLRTSGFVSAGVGVLAAAAGTLLFLSGNSKRDAIGGDASATPPRPYDESNGNWRTLRGAGIGLMVGGGAALLGGAALYLFGRQPGKPSERTVSLLLAPASSYCGVLQLTGRF